LRGFPGVSIFLRMKRLLLFAVLLLTFLPRINGQDNPAAAAAAREEAETRYQRLNARLDDIEVAFQRFQKDRDKVESEIRALRDQVSRLADNSQNAATQESIKRLADAIEEVDRKRVKHQENVDSALAAMEKLIAKGGSSTPRNTAPKTQSAPPKPDGSGKGYEYSIRANDNASKIAAALREQKGLKVTPQQIIDANPGLDWTRLKIGQKIFIPDPSAP
jgi:DNA repair exonuclease SbcCD ATPase subunit